MSNVLMVSNYASDTGYAWWLMEHFWQHIAERLPEDSTAFLAYPKVTTVNQQLQDAGIQIVELAIAPESAADIKEALKFVKANNIKTLYFTDRPYFSQFYGLLRINGVRTVVVHDHTPGDRPPIRGFKGIIKYFRNRLPFFTADLFLNVSPMMRERSISNGRIPPAKCISVQNGLPLSQKPLSTSTGKPIRETLGIGADATLVVCSSRLHEYKNVQFAIQVFASSLAEKGYDAHLLIIGDGPYEAELKAKADAQECRDRIHFLGFRKDVKEVLPQCDLAIHCSRGEGFSLSIIEFMWSGLPVLLPDVPSVCQAITSGKDGYIYRNDDLDDAKSRLSLLLADAPKRTSMGAAAKQTVLDNYTMAITDQQFSNALESVGI